MLSWSDEHRDKIFAFEALYLSMYYLDVFHVFLSAANPLAVDATVDYLKGAIIE